MTQRKEACEQTTTGPKIKPFHLQQLAADVDWRVLPHRPAHALLVLLALHANVDGIAWPSVRKLCRRLGYAHDGRPTGKARASFWRTFKPLSQRGLVRRVMGGPGGRLWHFHLDVFAIADAAFRDAPRKTAVPAPRRTAVARPAQPRRTAVPAPRKTAVLSTTPVQSNTSTRQHQGKDEQAPQGPLLQAPPVPVAARRARASSVKSGLQVLIDPNAAPAAAAHTGDTNGDNDDTLTDITSE